MSLDLPRELVKLGLNRLELRFSSVRSGPETYYLERQRSGLLGFRLQWISRSMRLLITRICRSLTIRAPKLTHLPADGATTSTSELEPTKTPSAAILDDPSRPASREARVLVKKIVSAKKPSLQTQRAMGRRSEDGPVVRGAPDRPRGWRAAPSVAERGAGWEIQRLEAGRCSISAPVSVVKTTEPGFGDDSHLARWLHLAWPGGVAVERLVRPRCERGAPSVPRGFVIRTCGREMQALAGTSEYLTGTALFFLPSPSRVR